MERQCRICLDTENQESLITPCLCRGSAEFIHRECLTRYIEHYPDGICRVCLVKFQREKDHTVTILSISLASLGTIVFYLSPVQSLANFFLFVLFLGMVGVYWFFNAFTSATVMVSMFLLLVVAAQTHMTRELAVTFLICLFVYTLFIYIPQPYLMMMMMIISVTCYVFLLLVTSVEYMNPHMGAIFLVMIYLIWNGVIRARPPLRFNNR